MPSPETFDLTQDALLWPLTGRDRHGQAILGDVVELKVRWLTKRSELTAADGTPVILDAQAAVDRRVEVGSEMWLGTLEDWDSAGSAGEDAEIHEVKTYSETPDVKGRVARRTVGLAKKGAHLGAL